jgi:hypothetical protein
VTHSVDADKSVDLTKLAAGIHSKLPRYARPLFLRRMTEVNQFDKTPSQLVNCDLKAEYQYKNGAKKFTWFY